MHFGEIFRSGNTYHIVPHLDGKNTRRNLKLQKTSEKRNLQRDIYDMHTTNISDIYYRKFNKIVPSQNNKVSNITIQSKSFLEPQKKMKPLSCFTLLL